MILYSTDSRQAPCGACPVVSATSEALIRLYGQPRKLQP